MKRKYLRLLEIGYGGRPMRMNSLTVFKKVLPADTECHLIDNIQPFENEQKFRQWFETEYRERIAEAAEQRSYGLNWGGRSWGEWWVHEKRCVMEAAAKRIAEVMRKLKEEPDPRIIPYTMDGRRLGFGDSYFNEVDMHWFTTAPCSKPILREVLNETWRVLAPGGVVVATGELTGERKSIIDYQEPADAIVLLMTTGFSVLYVSEYHDPNIPQNMSLFTDHFVFDWGAQNERPSEFIVVARKE